MNELWVGVGYVGIDTGFICAAGVKVGLWKQFDRDCGLETFDLSALIRLSAQVSQRQEAPSTSWWSALTFSSFFP